MRTCKTCITHIAIALLIVISSTAPVHANSELERKVKAAFVYNFAKFVAWPAATNNSSARFNICVAGHTALGDVISQSLENRTINSRKIHISDIGNSVEQLDNCQILYLNGSNSPDLGRLLAVARRKPILTIGENENFTSEGGIIQFLLVDGKVRFSINQTAADSAGLAISAKLLEVSYKVFHNQAALEQSPLNRRHVLL